MRNAYGSTGTMVEATVIAVDLTRKVSKCISDKGTVLNEVRWVVPMGGADGNGLSVHPQENSKVLIDMSTGSPIIIGAIPVDSLPDVKRPNIGMQGKHEKDIADYSVMPMDEFIRGPGTPNDQRVGDNLMTAEGGGIMGLLASGTSIIKSSPLAQIITSRIGDLVRVVSRNYEHFTDVDSTYKTSIRGKIFSIRDLFTSPDKSRPVIERDDDGNVVEPDGSFVEKPAFRRYEGDVMWAETIGPDYATIPVDEFPTEPLNSDDSAVVIKEYTMSYDGDEVTHTSTYTQDDSGNISREIKISDEEATSTKQASSATKISKQAIGEDSTSSWSMEEGKFHWDCNEGISIEGDLEKVVIKATESDTGVTITLNKNGELNVTTDGACNMTYGGNLLIDVDGTMDLKSTGNMTMDAPAIYLN